MVDDHTLVAQSLALALNSRGMTATRCPEVDAATVYAMAESRRPSLVLLDLDLGEHLDGADLVAQLRRYGCSVLMFTGSTDRFRIAAAVAAGALGWVSKTVSFETLLEQVMSAARGEQVMTATERASLLADYQRGKAERAALLASLGALSAREWTVLRRLADGVQAEGVAGELHLSVHTVRAQIRSIHVKLGVGSQLAAVAVARRATQLGLDVRLDAC